MHSLASLMPYYIALSRGISPESLGLSGPKEGMAYLQCLDPCELTGGGTAIGHPLGATGCRLAETLARILIEKNARYGCATARCGGGQGVATIIEREEYD